MPVETNADMRGKQIVTAYCGPCGPKVTLDLDCLPDDLPYHELRSRQRCRKYRNRNTEIRASWAGRAALANHG